MILQQQAPIHPLRRTLHRLWALAALALALPCGLNSARASTITWGAAQTIVDATDVVNTGILKYAYSFGNSGGGVPITVNTVPFAYNGASSNANFSILGGAPAACGPYFPPDASTGYDGILHGAAFAGTWSGLQFHGLTIGVEYAVQVWTRQTNYPDQTTFLDGGTGSGGVTLLTSGQFAIGTFIADATDQIIALGGTGKQINALQVRTVPVAGPPSVAITSPANNATVGANFTINATAADTGTITSVAFYDGATLLGTDTTDPYSYDWIGAPKGAHVLTAVATDDDTMSTTSAVVNVTVSNITWGAAQTIVDASDVLNTGTLKYAYAFGNSTGAFPITVNTVPFAYSNCTSNTNFSVLGGTPAACMAAFPPAASTGYDGILHGAAWAGTWSGLQFHGLTIGVEYAVQVWTRQTNYPDQTTFLDGGTSVGGVTLLTSGQFAIGTFTADATDQIIALGGSGKQINALQVRTVPVAGTPPSVAITSPADTATVGVNFTIDATASDDGMIASVTFSYSSDAGANWTPLDVDTEFPYSYTWNGAPEGIYQLKAVAVDNEAMTTPSAVVNVTVIDPPTVAITSPVDGATVTPTFTIDATATDNGSITSVDFYDGATLLGSDVTGPPYTYDWNSAPNGLHVLTAVAWDNEGHSTTSALVNVWVTNITWGSATNITDDNDVLKIGDLVYAYAFGSAGATVNTVPFAAGDGVTDVIFGYIDGNHWSGPYFGPNAGLSAEYNTILTGGNWAGADYSLTLSNLTSGTAYTVQVWSSIQHVNNGPSVYTSLDGVHLLGNRDAVEGPPGVWVGNGGQYLTGTFTASGSTQVIAIGGSGKQINAVQVRTVSSAVATETLVTGNGTSTVGDSVTLTATVSPTPTTGGTVQFLDNGTAFGSAVDVVGGVASLPWTSFSVGTHPITATFNGTADFLTSTSSPAVTQTVLSKYAAWAALKGLSPGVNDGANDDPDADGVQNFIEFALNGDPKSAADNGMIHVLTEDVTARGYGYGKVLILTIAVRSGTPEDWTANTNTATIDGITYTIEGGKTLGDFASDTGTVYACAVPIITGLPPTPGTGYDWRSFILSSSDGLGTKGFLRAMVVQD